MSKSAPSQEILDYIKDKRRLPSYNKTRELFEQFEKSTQKRPTNIKRGKCAEIENALMDIMLMISKAELEKEDAATRAGYIGAAMDDLLEVKLNIRILYDLHLIHPEGWSALMLLEDDLAGQLYSWKRETEKRIKIQ